MRCDTAGAPVMGGTALGLVLIALGGVLVGGAWSTHQQGASRAVVVVVALLAVLALAGGVLWLWG